MAKFDTEVMALISLAILLLSFPLIYGSASIKARCLKLEPCTYLGGTVSAGHPNVGLGEQLKAARQPSHPSFRVRPSITGTKAGTSRAA